MPVETLEAQITRTLLPGMHLPPALKALFGWIEDNGLNRPGFRRHLAAINYGLGGGGYEHEALHG